jgi:Mg2+ and Co2+ transporter CorA
MKPETVKQMKRFVDARDLLYSAHDQYETTLGAIKGALDYAERAMGDCSDEEALRQIASMRKLVADLPRAALDTLDAIAETMGALAVEVSADEEHVAAGVS